MEAIKRMMNGGALIQKEEITSCEHVPDEVIDQDITITQHFFSDDAWLRMKTTSNVYNCTSLPTYIH